MANIYKGTIELIGNTPLVEAVNLEQAHDLQATLLIKLEYLNPAGSVKDRIAKSMLEDAEQSGKLHTGSVIIEPTSGNTGIGLAASKGLSGDFDNAGNHERGTEKHPESIRCRNRSDRRCKGYEGCNCQGKGTCRRNSKQFHSGTV